MSSFCRWLLRITLLTTPFSFALAAYYGAQSADLAGRLADVAATTGTHGDDFRLHQVYTRATMQSAQALEFWTTIFHLSIGALGGLMLDAIARSRRRMLRLTGIEQSLAWARHARRRRRLLSARHPRQYATSGTAIAIGLMLGGVTLLAIGSNHYEPYGPDIFDHLFTAIGIAMFVASIPVSRRALALSVRTPGTFGDVTRFLTALLVFAVSSISVFGFSVLSLERW